MKKWTFHIHTTCSSLLILPFPKNHEQFFTGISCGVGGSRVALGLHLGCTLVAVRVWDIVMKRLKGTMHFAQTHH